MQPEINTVKSEGFLSKKTGCFASVALFRAFWTSYVKKQKRITKKVMLS